MTNRTHFIDVSFDPGIDRWVIVKVFRDGNPITLGSFNTEWMAEEFAAGLRED